VQIPWIPKVESRSSSPRNEEILSDQLNQKLIQALVRAHRWADALAKADFVSIEALAASVELHPKVVRNEIKLAFLAPGLAEAILTGDLAFGLPDLRKGLGAKLANTAGRTTSSEAHKSTPLIPTAREEIRVHFSTSHPRASEHIYRQLPCRRSAGELANGRPLERWPSSQDFRASRRDDPGFCRAHGTLARDFCGPYLDRRE
jgi:hypothetical protein